jgi:arylsulfatase A-like enzyme
MRYPRQIKAGGVRDALILNIDLVPTLHELSRIEHSPPVPFDGRSLTPVFGDAFKWRRSVLLEYQLNRGQTPRFPTWQAVRTAEWKYIHYPDNPDWDELYCLPTDPLELHNRIDDPSAADVLTALRRDLSTLLTESSSSPP